MYHGHATVIYSDVEGLRKKRTVEVVGRDDEYSYFRLPVFIDDQLDQVLLSSDLFELLVEAERRELAAERHEIHDILEYEYLGRNVPVK